MTRSSIKPAVLDRAEARRLPAAEWLLADLEPSVPRLAVFPEFELEDGDAFGDRDDDAEAAELAVPAVSTETLIAAAVAAERERLEAAHRAALERAVAEAHARGFEEGRQLGEEGEAARLRNALAAAEAALEELREGEMRWTGSIEENVCALAVAVARQVIGRELVGDASSVVELVRQALAEFPVDQPIRIRVSPGDLAAMQSVQEGGLLAITRDRDARWLPDPLIGSGGCVVEGRERIVDGRVDTALERLYRRLTYNHV
jgi:flagellar assembly protein FliH